MNVSYPEVLVLASAGFDYVATNGFVQNTMHAVAPVGSSNLSQRLPLRENTTTKLCVRKQQPVVQEPKSRTALQKK